MYAFCTYVRTYIFFICIKLMMVKNLKPAFVIFFRIRCEYYAQNTLSRNNGRYFIYSYYNTRSIVVCNIFFLVYCFLFLSNVSILWTPLQLILAHSILVFVKQQHTSALQYKHNGLITIRSTRTCMSQQ